MRLGSLLILFKTKNKMKKLLVTAAIAAMGCFPLFAQTGQTTKSAPAKTTVTTTEANKTNQMSKPVTTTPTHMETHHNASTKMRSHHATHEVKKAETAPVTSTAKPVLKPTPKPAPAPEKH